jgi:hypothetical protein
MHLLDATLQYLVTIGPVCGLVLLAIHICREGRP